MGAHTLGTLKRKNSGHDGPWIEGDCASTTFDHQYYVNMFEPTAPELEWSVRVSGRTLIVIDNCPLDHLLVHRWLKVVHQSLMREWMMIVDTADMADMVDTVDTAVDIADMVDMDKAEAEAAPRRRRFSSPNLSVETLRRLARLEIAA